MKPQCQTCTFVAYMQSRGIGPDDVEVYLECRKNPPVTAPGYTARVFPHVQSADWCGEYRNASSGATAVDVMFKEEHCGDRWASAICSLAPAHEGDHIGYSGTHWGAHR